MTEKGRKAQAAMEFLMTYGWAILVVLAAIAALAYFGVLDPGKLLPEKCILQPGIACSSHKVEPLQVTMVISNGLGRTITINQINVSNCASNFNQEMLSGDDYKFVIGGTCNNGLIRDKFRGDIVLRYTERDSGLTKTSFGEINTKIE